MADTEAKYIEKLNDINRIKNCAPQNPDLIVTGIPIKAAAELGKQLPTPKTDLSPERIKKLKDDFIYGAKYSGSVVFSSVKWVLAKFLNGCIYIYNLFRKIPIDYIDHSDIRKSMSRKNKNPLLGVTSVTVNAAIQVNATDTGSNKIYFDFYLIWIIFLCIFVFYNTYYNTNVKNSPTSIVSNIIMGWFLLLLLYQLIIPNKRWTFIYDDINASLNASRDTPVTTNPLIQA